MTKIDPWGTARLDRELRSMADMMARATPPARCGPAISPAPARGAFLAFQPRGRYPVGADGFEVRDSGYRGRDALRIVDVFDLMAAQAARRRARSPFTHGQVEAGRQYRALVERLAASGVRCSSLEARTDRGAARGGEWIDAVIADHRALGRLQARVGCGMALSAPRSQRWTGAGGIRSSISDRQLVELVCVADRSLTDVLKAFGWAAKGSSRELLRTALCGALDRMQGYGRAGAQDVG